MNPIGHLRQHSLPFVDARKKLDLGPTRFQRRKPGNSSRETSRCECGYCIALTDALFMGKTDVEASSETPQESFRTLCQGRPPPWGGCQTARGRQSREGGTPCSYSKRSRSSRPRARSRGKEGLR